MGLFYKNASQQFATDAELVILKYCALLILQYIHIK